ncbi:5'-nucleotidase C-terminal domain-containing protein [Lutimonas saemankumensis]|uniref:5'-nucleotidase C-terminal domain-containing protein n=1 Tax=Lutimonas saemankumensis TaxID=483016 RepID=UPI001CD45933|nr:5'-nucleotidase [Lutimonas saemankumensis]MCA0932171.1 5'-nucleotidase C-terminal domain-containing protein [Lutimonas saemankumensis]
MIRGEQLHIDEKIESNKEVIEAFEPYKIELENKINEVLCYNPRPLDRTEADLESSLGNFYADLCYQNADSTFYRKTGEHIDFALFNYGGIRTSLPRGDLKVENIFKLMPFENKLVIVKLSGAKTKELFDQLAKRSVAHPVSGVQLRLKNKQFSKIEIQGEKFDPDKTYWVLTHDYLQHGGDNMTFFKDPLELYPTNYKVRDAIIDHLKTKDTLYASLDNRFVKVK